MTLIKDNPDGALEEKLHSNLEVVWKVFMFLFLKSIL